MKYIKNTLDYAVSFKLNQGGKEKKFVFDCFRIYTDTGNIATTGVTPIADEDYELLLKENAPFKKFIESGILVNSKKSEANSVAGKIDDLTKENETLRNELKEARKALGTGETEKTKKLEEENKIKDDEIADLKAKLEAMSKKGKQSGKTVTGDKASGDKASGEEDTAGF